MGACASKFTVMKKAAAAPPPDVKQEVESREVNLVEEVAVNKDDAPAVEDDANRRQSLSHLLKENEGKKGSAEDVKQDDVAVVKPQAVADVARDESERAPNAEGLKLENVEEEIPACKNMEVEAERVDEKPAEAVKVETTEKVETKTEEPEENKAVEIPCTDKEPKAQKPASDQELKKEEEKTAEKTPEAQETEKTDVEKKETGEKSTETREIELSEKKPESPETEKTEEQKQAENTKIETSVKVEDKHVLEPLQTENCSSNETMETGSEEQKPVSDAEKPKAEELKANN